MVFLAILVLGCVWAAYLSLLMDRPDMLAQFSQQDQILFNIVFGVLFLIALARIAWKQIYNAKEPFWHSMRILSYNALVLLAGLGMLVFIGHELIHGIDPTGYHKLW